MSAGPSSTMALREVARFLDMSEAQTAAAALRASGMDVFLQNENWGQAAPYMQLAMGGFRLWAPEDDAEAARVFIRTCRATPSEIAPIGSPARAVVALALSLSPLGLINGWMAALFHRRGSRLPDDPAD